MFLFCFQDFVSCSFFLLVLVALFYTLKEDIAVPVPDEQDLVQSLLPNGTEEYSYYHYTLEEFSKAVSFSVNGSDDLKAFMEENEFDAIDETGSVLRGIKDGGDSCYADSRRDAVLCKYLLVYYDTQSPSDVYMLVPRREASEEEAMNVTGQSLEG